MTDGDGMGTAVTGTLIAQEVERARRDAPAVGHAADEPCANCGQVRVGPYCHACGQAGHVHRNFGALVHDLAHGVFHFEGKIWRTLPLLVRRPGELTRRYVGGERVKFVSPMALFLFSVFLMFAVMSGGHKAEAPPAQHGKRTEISQAEAGLAALRRQRAATRDPAAAAKLDERIRSRAAEVGVLNGLSHAGVDVGRPSGASGKGAEFGDLGSGWAWLDTTASHAAKNPDLLFYKLKNYAYKYSWALIPISVPFIWLLFAFRRDVGFYDHAIFAIYSLAFMSLGVVALVLLGKVGMPTPLLTLAAMLVPPVHMYRQLKGAYGLGRLGALWRTVALLAMTAFTLVLFAALVFYMGSS